MTDIEITEAATPEQEWEFALAKEIHGVLGKSYIVDYQPDIGNWLDKWEKCRPLIAIIKRECLAAFAAGEAKERVDVVGWFERGGEDSTQVSSIRGLYKQLANAISRGEHKEKANAI